MASVEPVELEEGRERNKIQEEDHATDPTDRSAERSDHGCCSRRSRIISIIVVVVVIAVVILGIVFGVVKKDGTSVVKREGTSVSSNQSSNQLYKVDIYWQAKIYDGWSFGYLAWRTDAVVRDGGAAWDDNKEFKVKLRVEGNGKAIVKSEVHHICCAHELQAGGDIVVDPGSWGDWGGMQMCRCTNLWYDHQIKAKVSIAN